MQDNHVKLQDNSRLLLLGYRATGKSSTGRMLAGHTGSEFIDTDSLIEKQEGGSISEIVRDQGWPGFRAIEKKVLKQVLNMPYRAVIAGGGGVVLHGDVLESLDKKICTVWLRASVETIVNRISGDSLSGSLRPSLTENVSMRQEVQEILELRKALYSRYSMFRIDTDNLGVEDIERQLFEIWTGYNETHHLA